MITAAYNYMFASPQIIINGKRNKVVESYSRYVEQASPTVLLHTQRVYSIHQLPETDPLQLKLNNAIKNTPLADIKAARFKRPTHPQPAIQNPETTFSQNSLTIAEVKTAIQTHGANWTEVCLNNVDDEMLQMMSQICTNMTSLRILEKCSAERTSFTDDGLPFIAKMTQLTTLELGIWTNVMISSEGLQDLLKQDAFVKNLKELNLMTLLSGDEILPVVSKYTGLTKFVCTMGYLTTAGLTTYLQYALHKTTLKTLNLNLNCTVVAPEALVALPSFTNLTNVAIDAKWNVTDANILTFLKAKPGLTSLELAGYALSQPIVDQIATMKELEQLCLNDCSKVGKFDGLLDAMKNLQVLLLGEAKDFTDDNLATVACYPNLCSLSLLNASNIYQGLRTFCNAPAMSNLRSFHLTGNSILTSHELSYLGNLASLQTLRLERIAFMNDDAFEEMTYKKPMVESLQALELNQVSLDDKSIRRFSRFRGLKTLMWTNCYAISLLGMSSFMTSSNLKYTLRKLYLDGVPMRWRTAEDFDDFRKLDALCLGNLNLNEDTFDAILDVIWKLPTIKKNNVQVTGMQGGLVSFEAFIKGL